MIINITPITNKENVNMPLKNSFFPFHRHGNHKGFYNDGDPQRSLNEIDYNDFFESPDDDDFPYDTAWQLLCGSCNIFVLALQKVFGYKAYIIEEIIDNGFHAFCQIYKHGTCYYVDARGITSSFDEFLDVAKTFVHNEFIIRPVTAEDEEEWKNDDYYEEAFAFAEAVIKKYSECYSL